jgi:hypothetical protein
MPLVQSALSKGSIPDLDQSIRHEELQGPDKQLGVNPAASAAVSVLPGTGVSVCEDE